MRGQAAVGVWVAAFSHVPSGPTGSTLVDPQSDSIANASRWITQNSWPNAGNNNTFQTIHTFLIPSGPHRGEVLALDGNLTNVGVRVYQPWAIINPYWPARNPYYGTNPLYPVSPTYVGYRFHNATLLMPGTHPLGMLQDTNGAGELFCGDGCWMPDGRLFFAGGTRMFPRVSANINLPTYNTGLDGGFDGAKLVYQWDERPNGGAPTGTDPFGK